MYERTFAVAAWLGAALWCVHPRARGGLDEALQTLRAVGREGQGNPAASQAWREVAGTEPGHLVRILEGMDGANPLAANWLRSAVETIASRTAQDQGTLPLLGLGQFLFNTQHDARARRLAFELITRADPLTGEKLLAGLLNDPGPELRREAVQRLIGQATETLEGGHQTGAALLYRQALDFARETDQIDAIAVRLRELGQPVDLLRTLGFIAQWRVIGPFDNTGGTGFARAFPPETEMKPAAEYDGKSGKVRWTDASTTNQHGILDINRTCGKLKEVTAYAFTEFISDTARAAELRLGCKNAWKVWLNGQFLFGREEYHRGMEIDQYRLPIQLQSGRNGILVKVCQNEQTEDWTVEWEFQLRICDALGTPLRPAPNATTHGSQAAATDVRSAGFQACSVADSP